MNASLWNDAGTWIALGVTVLTLVVAVVMHRVIVNILKDGSADTPHE